MLKTASSGERVQDIEMQERGQNARTLVILVLRGMHTKLRSIVVHAVSNHACATCSYRRATYLAS